MPYINCLAYNVQEPKRLLAFHRPHSECNFNCDSQRVLKTFASLSSGCTEALSIQKYTNPLCSTRTRRRHVRIQDWISWADFIKHRVPPHAGITESCWLPHPSQAFLAAGEAHAVVSWRIRGGEGAPPRWRRGSSGWLTSEKLLDHTDCVYVMNLKRSVGKWGKQILVL